MTHIKTVGTMGLAWSISVHSYGIPKNLVALAMRGSKGFLFAHKSLAHHHKSLLSSLHLYLLYRQLFKKLCQVGQMVSLL